MIELLGIFAFFGVVHAVYRLGKLSERPSWEFVGLSIVWGALWPIMLLLRWSEATFSNIRHGYRAGRVVDHPPAPSSEPEGPEEREEPL